MTTNLKILHIAPVNSNGELPTFLRHQIVSLSERSESQVITFRAIDLKFKNPIKTGKILKTFFLRIRTSEVDIIHAHWGSLLGFITALAKPRRIPMVITLRGSDVNKVESENWLSNTLRRSLTRYAVSHANFCIFVSSQLYDTYNKKLKNVAIIPDGTPLEIFKHESKVVARNSLNWSLDTKYIVFYCGGRPFDKNLILAMESIGILRKRFSPLEFIIIETELSQEEIAVTLSASDVLLFTSLQEGSPNIVREAIACGCPVVSVNVGDVEKWVDLSRSGQICHYDSECLSLALFKVIKEKQAADSSVAQEYSLKKSAERILDVYLKSENSNGH